MPGGSPAQTTWFVAPDGGGAGSDGSEANPYALAQVKQNLNIPPGSTIRLLPGTHVLTDSNSITLEGEDGNPITFISDDPDNRAVIDIGSFNWNAYGNWLRFEDIEIMSSVEQRSYADFLDNQLGSVIWQTTNLELINLHIHDVYNHGWWSGSAGTMKGCLVQNVGIDATDRGHGHCLYTQNNAGDVVARRKTIQSSILVAGFSLALQAYGSSSSNVDGYRFIGMALHGGIVIGNTNDTRDMEFDAGSSFNALSMGYGNKSHQDINVHDMVVNRLQINKTWQSATAANLVVLAEDGDCITVQLGQEYANLHIDNNIYISTKAKPFAVDGLGWFSLAEWQTLTGQDANSVHYTSIATAIAAAAVPAAIVQIALVNEGKHVANLYIWNLLEAASVDVDLASLTLANGNYELRQVRDYKNDIRAFVYDSGVSTEVAVDMDTFTTAAPTGTWDPQYHPTAISENALPYFGMFELWEA